MSYTMRKIEKIVIHHSVTPRTQDLGKSLSSFDRTHSERLHKEVNSLGWHIAYHYVIWDTGEIVETRSHDEVGYHASNWTINNTSLWICLVGNFDEDKPSEKQLIALWKLIRELQDKYDGLTIHFHNEYSSKSCPWKNVTIDMITKYVTDYEKGNYIYKENRIEPTKDWVIYYKLMNYTDDLHKLKTVILFNNAFNYWSQVLRPIRFVPTKVDTDASIKIWFAHPWDEILPAPFKPNSLAYWIAPYGWQHAWKIFINDTEDWWRMRKDDSHWLMKILVHEIGHALNISHTDDEKDIMYPLAKRWVHDIFFSDYTKRTARWLYRDFY